MTGYVDKHRPDWNELAWPVLVRLGANGALAGTDESLLMSFLSVADEFSSLGTCYLNPRYTIQAGSTHAEFVGRARRAQNAWLMEAKSVLGGSGALRRQLNACDPLLRQLRFTGVMIIAGRHIAPSNWPVEPSRLLSQHELVGRRFGRLTVLDKVPGGKWRCQCTCGGTNIVRTKHLLREKIRSCGCLKREIETRQQAAKASRAWIRNGLLP